MRACTDTSDSDYSHRLFPIRKFPVDEAHSALHDGHGGYHSHSSSTMISGNITVTEYHIHTSNDSRTSYHRRREYTAHDSHRSSSDHRETRHAPSYSSSSRLDDRDKEGFFDEGHRDPKRQPRDNLRVPEAMRDRHVRFDRHHASDHDITPEERKPREPQSSAEKRRRYPSYAHVKHSQTEEFEPANTSGYSGNHGQKIPNIGSSRRDEMHYNNRSNNRGEGDPRSNSSHRSYEGREKGYPREVPKPSQPKEPKPTYTDGHFSKQRSYSNDKYATKDNPSRSKPESGSSRNQEKPHSSRSGGRREGNPRSNYQEVPQPKAEEDLPDHYATLGINPFATNAEIKGAAKRRRVEVHPDKWKNQGMSDSECAKIDAAAAKVGQAADILQDPEQKRDYDRELLAAKAGKWHQK